MPDAAIAAIVSAVVVIAVFAVTGAVAFYVRPEIRERLTEGTEIDVRVDEADPTGVAVDPQLRLLGGAK